MLRTGKGEGTHQQRRNEENSSQDEMGKTFGSESWPAFAQT